MDHSATGLRVFADDLDPAEITRLLGAEPTSSYRRGDRISVRSPNPRKCGAWLYNAADAEPSDFDAQVHAIFANLTQDLSIWASLTERCAVDMFCGWFMDDDSAGFGLSAQTIALLAQRRVGIGFASIAR